MQPTQHSAPTEDMAPTPTEPAQPAPKSKRGLLVAASVVVAAAVAVGGFVVLGGDDATGASAVNSAFAEASTPTDSLAAAVEFTLSRPMSVTTTKGDVESTAQVDHANHIMFGEVPGGVANGAGFTMFMRPDDMLIRYAEDSGDTKAGQWYRMPVADAGMAPMLAQAMDPEFVLSFLESSKAVEEAGTEQVNGVDTTHYVVTMNKRAIAEQTLEAMSSGAGANAPAPTQQTITMMTSMIPDTTNYWVDGSGRLVKEDDGTQVKHYADFGEPIDLPEIDESAIEPLPGF